MRGGKNNLTCSISIYSYGVLLYEGIYYMVKELPELGTLHEYFEKYNNICWSKRISMASRLASAVAFFHSKRMLHHGIRR